MQTAFFLGNGFHTTWKGRMACLIVMVGWIVMVERRTFSNVGRVLFHGDFLHCALQTEETLHVQGRALLEARPFWVLWMDLYKQT